QRREPDAPGVAPEPVILERETERGLDRGRAGVRIEDPREPCWRDVDERARQLDRRHVREPEERRVRDPPELLAEGGVEGGMPVSVDVAPERRDAVEVAAGRLVDERAALGGSDDERLLREPVAHLRERMP